jgi:hypothetical protein
MARLLADLKIVAAFYRNTHTPRDFWRESGCSNPDEGCRINEGPDPLTRAFGAISLWET